jgi:hypothetical protein
MKYKYFLSEKKLEPISETTIEIDTDKIELILNQNDITITLDSQQISEIFSILVEYASQRLINK